MAKKKTIVTNAMRILNAAKIEFEAIEYETDGTVGEHFGEEIASKTCIPPEKPFKTLVVKGDKTGISVVCIPVNKEVNLNGKRPAKLYRFKNKIEVKKVL